MEIIRVVDPYLTEVQAEVEAMLGQGRREASRTHEPAVSKVAGFSSTPFIHGVQFYTQPLNSTPTHIYGHIVTMTNKNVYNDNKNVYST